MIRKSFLTSVAIFILFSLFLHFHIISIKGSPQNQWQENLIKAQEYIYDRTDAAVVIVGSSLAARLTDLPSKSYYNLAFAGGSPYEGLEIIKRAGAVPKLILVETNTISRSGQTNLPDKLFSPLLYNLRQLPPLREKNQPVTLLGPVIKRVLSLLRTSSSHAGELPKSGKQDHALLDRLVADSLRTFDYNFKKYQSSNMVWRLAKYVHYFEEKGTKIVFFEMPMHEKLCKSRLMDLIRERMNAEFTPQEYDYLPRVDCREYQTRDGMHLDHNSLITYESFFYEHVNSIAGQNGIREVLRTSLPQSENVFHVSGGTIKKGGIGYILSSSGRDQIGLALRNSGTPYKNTVTISGQMKSSVPSGTRNGFIVFGENPTRLGKTGVLIGGKILNISGPIVEKAERKKDFDPNKIFHFELAVNLKENSVCWKIEGLELKSKLTKPLNSINYIGYGAWSTTTEFSELHISGS